MRRALITVAAVGALTFSIYLATGGNVAAQVDYLTDAGLSTPTHVATCSVRISDECLAAAADAGVNVHRYERLRFPVTVTTLSDGGRDVQLPPLAQAVRQCVEVMDWSACTLVVAGSAPAVAAKWGQALPFTTAGAVRGCVRPKFDAGLLCPRLQSDGGTFSFGDRNVFPRAEAFDTAQCEAVECMVFAGEDPETEL